MTKYEVLINILDQLREEAPAENARYHPPESDFEKLGQARARAFIHLFLKVRFGILEFKRREWFITDGSNDGGIDAYYIDSESRTVFYLQSKFRQTKANFSGKPINLSDLLAMDVDRISEGEAASEGGAEYNGKIKQLQREISAVADIGKYTHRVILLANLDSSATSGKLKKWTGGFPSDVFDFTRTYRDLVFPVVSGTYYSQEELRIQLNLDNKKSQGARVSYNVQTRVLECEISVLFVPTLEIAKILYQFKNSILKFNPRSYLELSANPVNQLIAKTMIEVKTNEFALYNNGITMLSRATEFNDRVGQKSRAQLVITQPQIINGGQTAYTLSRIYEDHLADESKLENIFGDKEVLLKVITLPEVLENESDQLELIEAVSRATNEQTPVEEADRRANDKIQVELQRAIYNSYGYFYERKRGEYADGIRAGYIDETLVIGRALLIRLCKACDFVPSETKRSDKFLFSEKAFRETLNDPDRHPEYFFAYKCFQRLGAIAKSDVKQPESGKYGTVFRYGRYAAVASCRLFYKGDQSVSDVNVIVDAVLSKWKAFEKHISRLKHNSRYFTSYHDPTSKSLVLELNFSNYYKGHTLDKDLRDYFTSISTELDERIEKESAKGRKS